ncbi:hypothetical protein TESG_07612 [Trichophyton tonsurans CBS 112818]|uniref:Uncharacterized protein n=1 Tax=Trichophyton tonsurans (strain CBS 112818) TaxID=647933 RepID=F2S9R8_TRIT1|nr:hypothetical protein TESG_07612 [Trichophyton tonsurans CBS 112818]
MWDTTNNFEPEDLREKKAGAWASVKTHHMDLLAMSFRLLLARCQSKYKVGCEVRLAGEGETERPWDLLRVCPSRLVLPGPREEEVMAIP